MPRYPHSRLFISPVRSVVITGAHIQVLDTSTGDILHSTANFSAQDRDAVIKSGPIRCAAISHDNKYLATAGDDKLLKVWDVESLALMSLRELPKKSTGIEFPKDHDVLVADKFGDVVRYTLRPDLSVTPKTSVDDASTSHENPSGGVLVLGHASVLTGCHLTPDQRFIVTSDRDEHIRVSWYPEGYVIESYCLGHEKYVSAIHIPPSAPASLISGGGDPDLKIWNWMTGCLERSVNVFSAVEPFMMVKAPKRRLKSLNGGDDDTVITEKGSGRRKKKTKQKQGALRGGSEDPAADSPAGVPSQDLAETETVFVIHKIDSFVSQGGSHMIVFSVVGATALFTFSLVEVTDEPMICQFDCGRPIVDFTVTGDGLIWVLLDADYGDEAKRGSTGRLARAVRWHSDEFLEVDSSPLLQSLNSTCVIPAAPAELKALDLYSDLVLLPKHVDGEPGSQGREQSELPEGLEGSGTSVSIEKSIPKRTLGRLKHKIALKRLLQEQGEGGDSETPDTKRPKAEDSGDVSEDVDMELTPCFRAET
ncbi:WD40-repeat-containing domain protein [Pisolithus croceorrhizus]|nr:WD40-repeat-containing domain protein [Pisolithus croceorrhizus]KAI6167484.1 WD40-repeat-containing domain protein [Pisolithus thermaeus]